MLDLVIGGSFGDGLKSANSTLTVHLDGHPAPTAERRRISTTSSDTNPGEAYQFDWSHEEEAAAHVRWIFARFIEIGSCTVLAREIGARGLGTTRGNRIDKKYLYRMLSNRAYLGEAVHKGDSL